MKKTSLLIVEDEFPIALDIETRLIKMGFDIIGIAARYKEALPLIINGKPDMVMLDINLSEEYSGIDLALLIRDNFNIPVIFLTAYDDEATFSAALKSRPVGYIKKPFRDEELKRTILMGLALFEKQQTDTAETLEKAAFTAESDHLFIREKGAITRLVYSDILWLEAMDNYTVFHTADGRVIVNAFMKDVLEKIGPDFIRIHRSHAVHLKKINKVEENTVFLDKLSLPIGKSFKNDFIKRLNVL
jgi:two-component system, LytTR family, response regulator LytT